MTPRKSSQSRWLGNQQSLDQAEEQTSEMDSLTNLPTSQGLTSTLNASG